ncbi:response regulator [Marinilabiliaceae bacterium ANBcel2]|nr:response regulator [Marinilabiliaceae bacterium ANBcel2]
MYKDIPVILLVDDSNFNLEILKDALSDYYHLTASTGMDAIEIASLELKPDLILLDIIMPGIDGYSTCCQLKKIERTKDIPVIFITAQNDSDSIVKGFNAGAVDYISKPFNYHELQARVKTQLAVKIARDENMKLLKELGQVNRELTDSIEYAKKIQKASMPSEKFLNTILPEYFILLKPKDIVSGDFYWAAKVDGHIVIAAADCTGHGVPGAFMSMFGVAYLAEIVGNNRVTNPSRILDELRDVVIDSLQQDEKSEVKDGMDISIVSIDVEAREIEFAGAFNPLYLIREDEMLIYPADHMPVSIGEVDKPFCNHLIKYKKGDCFYLFSDGFASQFGGKNNKKLKKSGFKNMLLKRYKYPMQEQKMYYSRFFYDWKGDQEQVDDLLLLGFRM